jgi:hypothetical protein
VILNAAEEINDGIRPVVRAANEAADFLVGACDKYKSAEKVYAR